MSLNRKLSWELKIKKSVIVLLILVYFFQNSTVKLQGGGMYPSSSLVDAHKLQNNFIKISCQNWHTKTHVSNLKVLNQKQTSLITADS